MPVFILKAPLPFISTKLGKASAISCGILLQPHELSSARYESRLFVFIAKELKFVFTARFHRVAAVLSLWYLFHTFLLVYYRPPPYFRDMTLLMASSSFTVPIWLYVLFTCWLVERVICFDITRNDNVGYIVFSCSLPTSLTHVLRKSLPGKRLHPKWVRDIHWSWTFLIQLLGSRFCWKPEKLVLLLCRWHLRHHTTRISRCLFRSRKWTWN